jgi:hypothetical protein
MPPLSSEGSPDQLTEIAPGPDGLTDTGFGVAMIVAKTALE